MLVCSSDPRAGVGPLTSPLAMGMLCVMTVWTADTMAKGNTALSRLHKVGGLTPIEKRPNGLPAEKRRRPKSHHEGDVACTKRTNTRSNLLKSRGLSAPTTWSIK